jgi:hypothetical protein
MIVDNVEPGFCGVKGRRLFPSICIGFHNIERAFECDITPLSYYCFWTNQKGVARDRRWER